MCIDAIYTIYKLHLHTKGNIFKNLIYATMTFTPPYILYETFLHNRCRRSDSVRKQLQLKTGGGPPIVIDDDEEDIHERVRSVVPTIDFTLKNQWDSTSEIERNMEDIQDTFKEEEIGNKADLDKYERENYSESSNENDHVPCYLAGDLSANAGLNEKVSKEVLLNKCLTINSAKSTITKISESDSSLNRHSSKSSTAGSSIQRKSMNVLQNILPKNDENRLNKCKDLTAEPSNKKRKYPTGLEIEQNLRIQKLEESTKQQSELHIEKLRIIRKECEYWDKMRAAAELEMQAMQAQLKYWTAKYTAIESDILDI
ncbi:uncharacterized protein [Temnothorax longispinosus]|uniref:uncharacterized protein n=1 Tax=Temnothorax longispinosus TaxID=300112 RepID=UPI003A98D905